MTGTSGSHITLSASGASTKLTPPANTDVYYVDATNINSSTGGFTITDYYGSISGTTNWTLVSAYTFDSLSLVGD
jgi:hypothetical protein